jgi:hypothetical protein
LQFFVVHIDVYEVLSDSDSCEPSLQQGTHQVVPTDQGATVNVNGQPKQVAGRA